MDQVGVEIFDILDWAGAQSLNPTERSRPLQELSAAHRGTETLQQYDGTVIYWDRVQAILDSFFTLSERAEIRIQMIRHSGFCALPEFRGFWTRALAERRLQSMLRATAIIRSTRLRPRSAAVRRSD